MRLLSQYELLELLEFLPLHHAEDLPDQEPYGHLRALLTGLAENFTDGTGELAFFLGVEPHELPHDDWERRTVRDKSRLWYFRGDLTIGIGPEDLLAGTVGDALVCLPRALTEELTVVIG